MNGRVLLVTSNYPRWAGDSTTPFVHDLARDLTDVGWVDVERFGRPAADAAFLLVQHSSDLSLMLAALPEIEKDVRTGGADAQNYAFLHDRVRLITGGQQRFGTQVQETDDGHLVVRRALRIDPDAMDLPAHGANAVEQRILLTDLQTDLCLQRMQQGIRSRTDELGQGQ